jgi:hypothetical protein
MIFQVPLSLAYMIFHQIVEYERYLFAMRTITFYTHFVTETEIEIYIDVLH